MLLAKYPPTEGLLFAVCVLVFSLAVSPSSGQEEEDPVAGLEKNIPGTPGEDYPIFAFPPDTSFICDDKIEGYYADPEADCQSFNICVNFGEGDLTKYSLLCPNGTLFNQQYFICDWWFNVDCSQAEDFYSLNEEVAAAAAAAAEAANGRSEAGGAGEPSNELASYTLPGGQSDLLPPPAPLTLNARRNRGPKKNRSYPAVSP